MIIQNQNIDLTEITNTLGATTDGGGTSTKGSLMAKSNAILNKLNESSSNSSSENINRLIEMIESLHGGMITYTTTGSHTFTVPDGVSYI